jgi:hypothetical protein
VAITVKVYSCNHVYYVLLIFINFLVPLHLSLFERVVDPLGFIGGCNGVETFCTLGERAG